MKLFKSLSLIFNYAIFKKYLTFLGIYLFKSNFIINLLLFLYF